MYDAQRTEVRLSEGKVEKWGLKRNKGERRDLVGKEASCTIYRICVVGDIGGWKFATSAIHHIHELCLLLLPHGAEIVICPFQTTDLALYHCFNRAECSAVAARVNGTGEAHGIIAPDERADEFAP